MSTASIASADSASNTSSNEAAKVTAKLPELMIKPFSSNAYNWQTFWDSFRTSIHENKTLNKADQFSCSYLVGPVAAINGFSLTEVNCHDAIELLKVHSLSSGKGKMFLCATCHAFTPHVNAWKN